MTQFCHPSVYGRATTRTLKDSADWGPRRFWIVSPVPVEQGLGRHAADAVQYLRFTAHVRLICKRTAVSFWTCSSPGCWASCCHKNTENTCPLKRFSHLRSGIGSSIQDCIIQDHLYYQAQSQHWWTGLQGLFKVGALGAHALTARSLRQSSLSMPVHPGCP